MADNTNEENLNTPKENKSESSPDKITPTTNTETITQNQETENMEVHHHAHHEGKKNWKSYFWEFLMLFLAVFCGFLAEYQLEHKIEKDRAKQYVQSFYNDLKTDTAEFARLIVIYERKKQAFSMRNECFDSLTENIKLNNTCFNNLIRQVNGFPDMVNADQTLLQLKNAGGLRLLAKTDADSILEYDKQIRSFLKYETTGFQERQYRMRDFLYANLNYKSIRLKEPDPNLTIFIDNDPVKINTFFVMLNEYANASNRHLDSLKILNTNAVGLIDYFKEKYHYQ
jgi:hypothetical protein